ncbi:hypothetical protein TcWFU_003914 [Taenia crassiceps]|uniref:Uncharacterized protein n=1 Tax=Taenia crassiceps TaxID=6207 RepID=A0ABR4QDH9_9CEST
MERAKTAPSSVPPPLPSPFPLPCPALPSHPQLPCLEADEKLLQPSSHRLGNGLKPARAVNNLESHSSDSPNTYNIMAASKEGIGGSTIKRVSAYSLQQVVSVVRDEN